MDDRQSNERRFLYFYFNRDAPQRIEEVVPAHVEYWRTGNLKEYVGGPFSDRTGGLITFSASSLEEATNVVLRDPFILEDLVIQKWIKEWLIE